MTSSAKISASLGLEAHSLGDCVDMVHSSVQAFPSVSVAEVVDGFLGVSENVEEATVVPSPKACRSALQISPISELDNFDLLLRIGELGLGAVAARDVAPSGSDELLDGLETGPEVGHGLVHHSKLEDALEIALGAEGEPASQSLELEEGVPGGQRLDLDEARQLGRGLTGEGEESVHV
jgi:hypothetical protein